MKEEQLQHAISEIKSKGLTQNIDLQKLLPENAAVEDEANTINRSQRYLASEPMMRAEAKTRKLEQIQFKLSEVLNKSNSEIHTRKYGSVLKYSYSQIPKHVISARRHLLKEEIVREIQGRLHSADVRK